MSQNGYKCANETLASNLCLFLSEMFTGYAPNQCVIRHARIVNRDNDLNDRVKYLCKAKS